MKRKPVPAAIEAGVLLNCARRCALCLYLRGDLGEKHGQIAHLDRDPANFSEDNLAFLCLEHHSVMDSTTSQHKNYTLTEVKAARALLCEAIAMNRHVSAAVPAELPVAVRDDAARFDAQFTGIGDTDILKRIWEGPRWRVAIRPMEFADARFRDIDHCEFFVRSSSVPTPDSTSTRLYPSIPSDSIERDARGAWISGEMEYVKHLERWMLFRSGHFVHNFSVPEIKELGRRLHWRHVTAIFGYAFEFAARMAREDLFGSHARIGIHLYDISGFGLVVPDGHGGTDVSSCWARKKVIGIDEVFAAPDLRSEAQKLARDQVRQFFREFGWSNLPDSSLAGN